MAGHDDGVSPPRRATIIEVAERAGVSRSTASRALTGTGYVANGVRARVRRAAEELGYVVDATARSLKQQSSRLIGVMVSDLRNPFYADLAFGAGRAARAAGYTMMLIDDGGVAADEIAAANQLVASRVAGVVATPVSPAISSFLRRQRVPLVEVDRRFDDDGIAVVVDNRGAARSTTEHLLALGHRRIALLIDETDWTTGRDRHAGYADALEAAGVEHDRELVISAGWDAEEARLAASKILRGAHPPTAAFAANNLLAEGVWRAAREAGMRIPDDLSLVAFDDAPWMSMVEPGVTAVTQDAVALGAAAVKALLDAADLTRAAEAGARVVVLPAGFVRRGSTSRPRA